MNNDGENPKVAEEAATGGNSGTPSGSAIRQPAASGTAAPVHAAVAAATGGPGQPTGTVWGPIRPGAGPNPGVLPLDPARLAEDANLVKLCTAAVAVFRRSLRCAWHHVARHVGANGATGDITPAVEQYRQGRIDKHSAIAALVYQFAFLKRPVASGIAPYVDQLDEHDKACALAAASAVRANAPGAAGTRAARGADAVSGDRDQLASQSAPAPKRRHIDIDSGNADENDSDDDAPPSKRSSSAYDSDAAAFRVGLRPRFLSPLAQRTLNAQTNYLADVKRAKRELLATGSAPAFPLELWDDILANRAVDFDKIYSASFSSVIVDTTEHRLGGPDSPVLHLPNARPRKRVDDFADWLFCFHKWNEAVCAAFPFRRDELLIYLEFFTDLFNSIHKSHHARVIQADTAIRNASANDPSLTLCDKDRLHVLAMRHVSPWGADIGAVRSDSASNRSSNAPRAGRLNGQSRAGSAGEICKNYNRGACYRDTCRYAHKCNHAGCNESHPATTHDGDSAREASQNGGGRGGQRK
ncbi:hypothetical protein EXIGLDRAFT_833748 [Exidia glandulosa HHB12029]|uniref:C3H1-type domain-containing protein n=1 Tax=Exidia glandulosa HHB12029 TaxID=1314781 RepID=A0A165KFH2_EXIGL|nr:hypothetical protein EXIGLDRAFT_833748 [Exidia glandulosa HHB12029]